MASVIWLQSPNVVYQIVNWSLTLLSNKIWLNILSCYFSDSI